MCAKSNADLTAVQNVHPVYCRSTIQSLSVQFINGKDFFVNDSVVFQPSVSSVFTCICVVQNFRPAMISSLFHPDYTKSTFWPSRQWHRVVCSVCSAISWHIFCPKDGGSLYPHLTDNKQYGAIPHSNAMRLHSHLIQICPELLPWIDVELRRLSLSFRQCRSSGCETDMSSVPKG